MTKKTTNTPNKKNVKTKKVSHKSARKTQASVELANECIHALALFTNAVITERGKSIVSMDIPVTLVVGKKKTEYRIANNFMLDMFRAPECRDMALETLGEYMFMAFCKIAHNSPGCNYINGKRLSELKKYEIVTQYGDKCIVDVKNDSLTFVKAKAPKAKKK